MGSNSNLISRLGIPEEFAVGLLIFSFVLLLAPYFAGSDFGIFKVPKLPLRIRKRLRILAPFFFVIILFLFIPFPFLREIPKVDLSVYQEDAHLLDKALVELSVIKVPPQKLRYVVDKNESTLKIYPKLGYVDLFHEGEILSGLRRKNMEFFHLDFPTLAFKVLNDTSRTVLISEIVLNVEKSEFIKDQILVTDRMNDHGSITIYNDGWGAIIDPSLNLGLQIGNCSKEYFFTNPVNKVDLETFEDSVKIDIRPYVTDKLYTEAIDCKDEFNRMCVGEVCERINRISAECIAKENDEICRDLKIDPEKSITHFKDKLSYLIEKANVLSSKNDTQFTEKDVYFKRVCYFKPICVFGELTYFDEAFKQHNFRFFSEVDISEEPKYLAPIETSAKIGALLEAGKNNEIQRFSVAQSIKPGESDQFHFYLSTNRSAKFNMTITLVETGGMKLSEHYLNVLLYVPKTSAWRFIEK